MNVFISFSDSQVKKFELLKFSDYLLHLHCIMMFVDTNSVHFYQSLKADLHSDVQCIIFNLCVLTADEENNNSEAVESSKKLSKTVQDYNLIELLDMNTLSAKEIS